MGNVRTIFFIGIAFLLGPTRRDDVLLLMPYASFLYDPWPPFCMSSRGRTQPIQVLLCGLGIGVDDPSLSEGNRSGNTPTHSVEV
jgi:hypothetical protein